MEAWDRLNNIMEQASRALIRMDYLACEQGCLAALAIAREHQLWPEYARVLLPLQECRRQRRMVATGPGASFRFGSGALEGSPIEWLNQLDTGCIVVTWPHGRSDAAALAQHARRLGKYVEVLFADNNEQSTDWELGSYAGPVSRCAIEPPPATWIGRWIDQSASGPETAGSTDAGVLSGPVDWYLAAMEALGDAALGMADAEFPREGAEVDPRDRVTALEACLEAISDHELLHQNLEETARRMTHQSRAAIA